MTVNDGLRERRGSTARTRRSAVAVAVTLTAALALTGGCSLSDRTPEPAGPESPAGVTLPDVPATLPWASAMVARDGTGLTVYSGVGDAPCKELAQPQATVIEQDGTHVVVTVKARIVDATDCATTGSAVPLTVSLAQPLGDRLLRDAATGLTPPAYFERDLPDPSSDQRWSPHPSTWASNDRGWYQGYNGPQGSTLRLAARPTAEVSRPEPVTTVRLGSHRGTVTGAPERSWTAWWEVGAATYSARLTPSEGGRATLAQFTRELARLSWR